MFSTRRTPHARSVAIAFESGVQPKWFKSSEVNAKRGTASW